MFTNFWRAVVATDLDETAALRAQVRVLQDQVATQQVEIFDAGSYCWPYQVRIANPNMVR